MEHLLNFSSFMLPRNFSTMNSYFQPRVFLPILANIRREYRRDFFFCHCGSASQANNDNTAWTWSVGEVAQRCSQQRSLQVVLVSPQIPGNTGCIARTCAATCVGLHLVEPLGFKIDNSKLKRAGLDYWPYVVVKVHSSWTDFFAYFQQQEGEKRLLAFTKHGKHVHTDVKYRPGDWLLFGSEVDGLPPAALEECHCGPYAGGTVRLPMNDTFVRSLNLSVSAGVGVYEALRQLDAENNYSSLDVSPSDSLDESMLMFMVELIFC
ncbi:unnamed protein product [Sphagnum jensenii]|uniref:tRNA/rRNA methyltransferase SpoU type domain-containing protein n=1 Tax=Sphagnum jensenii TaxID=128206 RepID=A0ABP0WLD4_9BRYO